MRAKILKITLLTVPALVLLLALLIVPQLELPMSTGTYKVGQTVFSWVDKSRPEVMTDDPNDFREVIATIWYPAKPGTGSKGPYFPGLSTISKALVESGEVGPWEVFGLQFIRSRSEEHTSELQSQSNLVCRLLLE